VRARWGRDASTIWVDLRWGRNNTPSPPPIGSIFIRRVGGGSGGDGSGPSGSLPAWGLALGSALGLLGSAAHVHAADKAESAKVQVGGGQGNGEGELFCMRGVCCATWPRAAPNAEGRPKPPPARHGLPALPVWQPLVTGKVIQVGRTAFHRAGCSGPARPPRRAVPPTKVLQDVGVPIHTAPAHSSGSAEPAALFTQRIMQLTGASLSMRKWAVLS
jgi:hypothetical protein